MSNRIHYSSKKEFVLGLLKPKDELFFRRVMYAVTHVSFLMCVEYISLFCIGNSCFLRKDACLKMNVILLFND